MYLLLLNHKDVVFINKDVIIIQIAYANCCKQFSRSHNQRMVKRSSLFCKQISFDFSIANN